MSLSRTRPVVAGLNGAVASAHPLASQAGLRILQDGGNAVDAVVTMAAALAVVEPYMSGPGGVGFLLLNRADGSNATLNFSGRAPAAATPDKFDIAPDLGSRACMVPGNVAGWCMALHHEGTMTLQQVFAPAIRHARDGFPLHPGNAKFIEDNRGRLNEVGLNIFSAAECRIGGVLQLPDLGNTFERISQEGPAVFYEGEIGQQIADYAQLHNGLLTREDMATYLPKWETPIEVSYRGNTVRTCPPNNEGFQILQTLKLLEEYDLASLEHNSTEYIHLLTEAIKIAVADRIQWGGDPDFRAIPIEQLLSDEYVAKRRTLIQTDKASRSEGERWMGPRPDHAIRSGSEGLTTHLAAVDAEGNVASITQSLGNGFGAGFFVPQTGVALNNFIWWTEIDPDCPTPNLIEPKKRWSSCMAPVHVLRDGTFWFSIATPGSYGILHTTLQMVLNILEFNADCQAAIEAPRFRVWEDTRVQIEDRVCENVRAELTQRGHAVELLPSFSPFVGGGQSVMIDPQSAARLAGADPRRDGYALAY